MGKNRALALLAAATATILLIVAATMVIVGTTLFVVPLIVAGLVVGLIFLSSSNSEKKGASRKELTGLETPRKFIRGSLPRSGRMGQLVAPTRSTVELLMNTPAPKSDDERNMELEEEGQKD